MATFKVGSATVTRVEEILEPGFDPAFLFPGFDPEILVRHPQLASPNFFHEPTGKVISSIQSWLLRIGGKTILVDTCTGNGKARALPVFKRFHMLDLPYLDNLARAGVHPDEVDIVFCTHLHIDHVGWNTRRDADGKAWVPTFRNARYFFGRAEFEHWTQGNGPQVFPENVDVIEDSVLPVVEEGMVEFVDDGDVIMPGLTVEAAPGHTATQLILKYREGDAAFVCSADTLHQPIQVYEPDYNSCFCELQDEARRTRRRLLEECSDDNVLLLPMHFGPPHGGYVKRAGDGFSFTPAEPARH